MVSLVVLTMTDTITFKAKIGEASYELSLARSSSLLDAKILLSSLSSVDINQQKWIYKGRILNDNNCSINDANIKESDTIIVMKTAGSSSSSSTPSSSTPTSSSSTTTSSSLPTTPLSSTPLPSSIFNPPPINNQQFDNAMYILLENNNDKNIIENTVNLINKIIINIINNPHNEKYRKISKSNKTFTDKIYTVTGGIDIMTALNFQPIGDDYVMTPSADAWNNLIASKTKLDRFVQKLQLSSSSSSTSSSSSSSSSSKVAASTQESQKVSSTDTNNDTTLLALQQMLSILALQQTTNTSTNTTNTNTTKDDNDNDNENDKA